MALNPVAACAALGVRFGAPWQEIHRAYRKSLLTAHPDKGGNAEDLRRVTRAYECLKRRHSFAPPKRSAVGSSIRTNPRGRRAVAQSQGSSCRQPSDSGNSKRPLSAAPARLSSLIGLTETMDSGSLQRVASPVRIKKRTKQRTDLDPLEVWRKDALAMADIVSCGMAPIGNHCNSGSPDVKIYEALVSSSTSGVAPSAKRSRLDGQGSKLTGRLQEASAAECRVQIRRRPEEKLEKRPLSPTMPSSISSVTTGMPVNTPQQVVVGIGLDLRHRLDALLVAKDICIIAQQLREVDKGERRLLIQALPADIQVALEKHMLAERRCAVATSVSEPLSS